MMVTVRRRFWFGALHLLVHQTVRRGHAPMRVLPVHTQTNGPKRGHAHLNGQKSDRDCVPVPGWTSHETNA
jgi:hypothetical protein